jgi:hypothetical protein
VADSKPFSAVRSFRQTFAESVRQKGLLTTLGEMAAVVWRYSLEQILPERRRARWGDIDFDFDRNVDTTRANVSFRTQMLAALVGTPYFPSQPYLFEEMMRVITGEQEEAPASPILGREELREFTFIDLGSGKGRSLLLASDYPFRRIIGVELIPELHAIAEKNIAAYNAEARGGQGCRDIQAVSGDAREFEFPVGSLFVYLFNPFPVSVHERVLENLRVSLEATPRPAYVAYRLPEYEQVLAECGFLQKIAGTEQWVLYRTAKLM